MDLWLRQRALSRRQAKTAPHVEVRRRPLLHGSDDEHVEPLRVVEHDHVDDAELRLVAAVNLAASAFASSHSALSPYVPGGSRS